MADNTQKTPLVASLQDWFNDQATAFQNLAGKALPSSIESIDATGTIVTVKIEVVHPPFTFPLITCPVIANGRFIRLPLKKGDKGVLLPADVYLGGMSGLGGGTADLTELPNLTSNVWAPLGNTDFDPTSDPNAVDVNGPNGTISRTQDSKVKFVVNSDGFHFFIEDILILSITRDGIMMTNSGNNISLDADGIHIVGGPVNMQGTTIAIEGTNVGLAGGTTVIGSGNTTIDGVGFLPHTHSGVTSGGGTSGPVDP